MPKNNTNSNSNRNHDKHTSTETANTDNVEISGASDAMTLLGNWGSTPVSMVTPVIRGDFGHSISTLECIEAFALLPNTRGNTIIMKSTTDKVWVVYRLNVDIGGGWEYFSERLSQV